MACFRSLASLCRPKQSSINCDSDFGSGARLGTAHKEEEEEVPVNIKPSLDVSSSLEHSSVARLPSKTRPASSGRALSSGRSDHPFGLKLFNVQNCDCIDSGEYQVDVIAVHGLDGHRERTWTFSEGDKQSSEHGPLWLRDFLPQDLPGSRIFTYGYNSRVLASRSVSSINDFARQLLRDLQNCSRHHEVREFLYFECI